MDELTRIIEQRPDDQPPTDAQRATARAQLMAHIDQAEVATSTVVPATIDVPAGRRSHRAIRWAAMASAAAVIALIATVVSLTGNGPGPIADQPAAAEQLRAIAAQAEQANPYPSEPYGVTSRLAMQDTIALGNHESDDSTTEHTTWSTGNGNYITRASGCPDGTTCVTMSGASAAGDPWIPGSGTAAQVRAGLERRVDDTLQRTDGVTSKSWETISTAASALQTPSMGPVGRAELLRMIAENAQLTSTTGQTNHYGLSGTRFTATTADGRLELLVDPDDGYVLELRIVGPSTHYTVDEHAEDGYRKETGRSDLTFSNARPVAGPLPGEVAHLSVDIDAHVAEIEASWPNGGCAGGTGNNPGGQDWGIAIPDDLSFNHCWLP